MCAKLGSSWATASWDGVILLLQKLKFSHNIFNTIQMTRLQCSNFRPSRFEQVDLLTFFQPISQFLCSAYIFSDISVTAFFISNNHCYYWMEFSFGKVSTSQIHFKFSQYLTPLAQPVHSEHQQLMHTQIRRNLDSVKVFR